MALYVKAHGVQVFVYWLETLLPKLSVLATDAKSVTESVAC